MKVLAKRSFSGGRRKIGDQIKSYKRGETYDVSEDFYNKVPRGSFAKVSEDESREQAKRGPKPKE